MWFVFVTPATTISAIVLLVMCRRGATTLPKLSGWLTVTVSVLANTFVLLGMAG